MRFAGPVTLPSGVVVHVRVPDDVTAVSDDSVGGQPLFGGRLLQAVEQGRFVVQRGGQSVCSGDLLDLPLRDYHALRDLAERLGAIEAEPAELICRNCGAVLAADPARAPLDDLDEWYADDAPPPEPPLRLPEPVPLDSGEEARELVMTPVTARDAVPLWSALVGGGDVRCTPELVAALGIGGLGTERRPARVARALEGASDAAWDAVGVWFILVNYAERSSVPVVCRECGTVHDVPAPSTQEMEPAPETFRAVLADATPPPAGAPEAFPDEEVFAAMVDAEGEVVYRERGVRHIALIVDPEVPPVDGSGEPLLGSYAPLHRGDSAGYTDLSFEIRLYYRSFRNQWDQEGPYDVRAEIRETLDHEVDHHLHFLSGHDPMDEAEREEALRDLERTFGRRAVRRARRAEVLGEARRIAVLLALVAAVLGVMVGALYLAGILRI
ncbi:MAG: hypothetical protein ACOC5B_03120 [Myxococcota bacterium]